MNERVLFLRNALCLVCAAADGIFLTNLFILLLTRAKQYFAESGGEKLVERKEVGQLMLYNLIVVGHSYRYKQRKQIKKAYGYVPLKAISPKQKHF